MAPIVQLLLLIFFPITYPASKVKCLLCLCLLLYLFCYSTLLSSCNKLEITELLLSATHGYINKIKS